VSTYTTYLAHYLEDAGGATTLDVPSIGPGSAVGTPTVSASGSVSLNPPSISPASMLGTPSVTASGSATVTPPPIGPTSTLGAPTVSGEGTATIAPPSIGPGSVLGIPTVSEASTGNVDMTILPVANQLLDCLCTEIAQVPEPPASCCLRTGLAVVPGISLTEDECCSGLAWVRVVSSYPSEQSFPEQDGVPNGNCAPQWYAVVLEMGVVRCGPSWNAEEMETCADWTTVSGYVMNDDAAMRRAFCCLPVEGMAKVMGVWEPLPNEGRCVGGTRTVTVQVPNCDGGDCLDGMLM